VLRALRAVGRASANEARRLGSRRDPASACEERGMARSCIKGVRERERPFGTDSGSTTPSQPASRECGGKFTPHRGSGAVRHWSTSGRRPRRRLSSPIPHAPFFRLPLATRYFPVARSPRCRLTHLRRSIFIVLRSQFPNRLFNPQGSITGTRAVLRPPWCANYSQRTSA
jgi:hypothetical protein